MDQKTRRIYTGLFLANFLITLGFSIADPFVSVYALSKGAGGLHLALLFSGYGAAKTLMSPVAGWWSDRSGRRSLILTGLCLYAGISLFYLSRPDPVALVALRFMQGIAAAMVRPVSLALVGDMAPEHREGAAMGAFDISFYAALATGPVIGGFLKDLAGFPGIFSALSTLCPLALFTALFCVTGEPERAAGPVSGPAVRGLSLLRKRGLLLGLSAFIFARSFGITFFTAFIPVYMCEDLRLSGLETGIIMSTGTIVIATLLRPMGLLSDRMERTRLVTAGGVMAALFTFMIPLADGFGSLFLICAGIGISSVISLPASFALLVDEGNRSGMGLVMGIFNGAMNAAAVIAPLVGGALFSCFGVRALFYAAGIVGLSGSVAFIACTHTAERRKREGDAPGIRRGIWKEHADLAALQARRAMGDK